MSTWQQSQGLNSLQAKNWADQTVVSSLILAFRSCSFSTSCPLPSFDRLLVKSGSLLENVNECSDGCFLRTFRESITSTFRLKQPFPLNFGAQDGWQRMCPTQDDHRVPFAKRF